MCCRRSRRSINNAHRSIFKEAQALCERDGGRLWGVSICMPMVVGDARTQTFATSQPPPDAPRSTLIGLLNGPIQWGDTMWAALTWDTIANWPPRTRGEAFVHESFHIVQPPLVLNGPAGANEHLDSVDGRYWLRLEWRALRRRARLPGHCAGSAEGRALYITAMAPPICWSEADAIARALELLAGAEEGESFARTFTYTSGPAYGLLLDAASPGWTRTVRGSDDPPAMLMRALAVQPVVDMAARCCALRRRRPPRRRRTARAAAAGHGSPSYVSDSLTARCS